MEKDIWKFKFVGKRNEICYTGESIRHPAKMELNMCREIIKKYSNKGGEIKVTQEMLDYWDKKINWSQDDN